MRTRTLRQGPSGFSMGPPRGASIRGLRECRPWCPEAWQRAPHSELSSGNTVVVLTASARGLELAEIQACSVMTVGSLVPAAMRQDLLQLSVF